MKPSVAHVPSRTVVPLLLGALALTFLSFVVSTVVVVEQRARGIEDAAESITGNAMPSIEHLAGARSDLRHMEGLLIEYAHGAAAGKDVRDLLPKIRGARAEMAENWAAEKDTPLYPGEYPFWVEIDAATAAVDDSVERVLAAASRGDPAAEGLVYSSLRPTVDRLAEVLLADIRFHAKHAQGDAATIARARTRQRTFSAVLEGAGAAFALIAGVVVAHVLRRYMTTTEARITELDLFAARVAHDIRSPLASVGLAIDLARRRRVVDEEGRAMLDRASRSVQRAGHIVDALLVLAGASAAPAGDARAEVRALALDAFEELRPAACAKGVALELDPFDPVEVACAAGVLGTVLSNLIGNAIKYIGDGPSRRVRVGARVGGATVRVEVADTGPGVAADLRDRIFDPYVRASSSTIPGLGLGLATVRRIVEAHGGRVGVDAVPGGGSRFWFELPKAVGPPGGGAPEAHDDPRRSTGEARGG